MYLWSLDEDPYYDRSFLTEYSFEYSEDDGAKLKPWKHIFPANQFPGNIKKGWRGIGYNFYLFDGNVEVYSSTTNSDIWSIDYLAYYYQNPKFHELMKNLSFNHPKEMNGALKSIEIDLITGVRDGVSCYSRCGVRLNCIHLKLENESWIYIRSDHPIITKKVDKSKIRYVDHFLEPEAEIYYLCTEPFSWFKIHHTDLQVSLDEWVNIWGGKNYWDSSNNLYEEE